MDRRALTRRTALTLALCLCISLLGWTGAGAAAAPAATAVVTGQEALPTFGEIMGRDRLWHYLDDPARLAQIQDGAWTQPDFDDAGWLMAAGDFGVYEGKLDTVVDREPTVCLRQYLPFGQSIPTYYFRLPFTADPAALTDPLQADIVYDDAVVVYLNGQEILSANTPAGGYPVPNAYGCAEIFGELPVATVTIDSTMLRQGENVLCVELHQDSETSRDIYFSMSAMAVGDPAQAELRSSTLCLGVGENESEMTVTWRGPIVRNAYVQVQRQEEGTTFSDGAVTYPAQRDCVDLASGLCTYRAAVTGLEPGTYVYQAVDEYPTPAASFTVREPGSDFSFLCHGDAQIVHAEEAGPMEIYQTLAEFAADGRVPQLVLSLGDQVDTPGDEAQYQRFTGAPLLKSVPLAAVVGNHETDDDMFSQVFTLPNMDADTVGSSGDMSGDYWFFRGNTLFLCLNSNNDDVDGHRRFLQNACEACAELYGQPVWTVAAFHHAPFSAGYHADSDSTLAIREAYPAMLAEAGVDVVFSGHDHSYTRSWPMDGQTPLADGGDGIVYFTLGSSTGSKYYNESDGEADYAAFYDDELEPEMTRVDVTDSTFTVTTYQMQKDGIQVLDTYQITADRGD